MTLSTTELVSIIGVVGAVGVPLALSAIKLSFSSGKIADKVENVTRAIEELKSAVTDQFKDLRASADTQITNVNTRVDDVETELSIQRDRITVVETQCKIRHKES
jgi:mannitol-specific phosphotransferase system IIBC component